MTRFVLTPAAKADLEEIVDFIREDSPDAAQRVLRELRQILRVLHSARDVRTLLSMK